MPIKIVKKIKDAYSIVKDVAEKTAKEAAFLGAMSLPVILPFLAGENIHAQERSNPKSDAARELQEDEATGFFSDYIDVIGKVNAEASDDYNKLGTSVKLSRDPIGLYAFVSKGNQSTSSGDVGVKESGFDVGAYHPFKFNWGKINAGIKFGSRDTKFSDYPIEKISTKQWGIYSKFIGDAWKAFLRYDQTSSGSFKYGGDNDYSESSMTIGFKKFLDNIYVGMDFDKYSTDFGNLGEETDRIVSIYGGKLGGDVFDDVLVGVYGGSKKGYEGGKKNISPGIEVRLRKILGNHSALGVEGYYQKNTGLGARLKYIYRFKGKK